MHADEIRNRFLDFFKERGHAIVPSSSLVPDDPSVLHTTAGMQQFKPYYTGEADPERTIHPNLGKPLGSKNAASVQKSFRTSDIDEIGDESHLTFFEMLGNFSFGGYFKEEAIRWAHEFITEVMNVPISYVTIFKGSAEVPKDDASKKIWNSIGVTDVREEGIEDVFWGPTGSSGPCGPTTEIYCRNASGKDIEIWNIVFNEFLYPGSREELLTGSPDKKLERLKTPGVDTGMGLERLATVSQKTTTIFDTDLFAPLSAQLPDSLDVRKKRIIADHLRGACFLIADGVRPSNKGAEYVLRRLLRRVYGFTKFHTLSGLPGTPEGSSLPRMLQSHILDSIAHEIVHLYGRAYPELQREAQGIFATIEDERRKFLTTLERGLREFRKLGTIDAEKAFQLYETYGLPLELTNDVIRELSGGKIPIISKNEFQIAFERHQEISRAGKERKFGGHGLLLDTGELKAADEAELEKVTRLHTATHLLNAALRKVLGDTIEQAGSDITAERTRFDFKFSRKLTPEELTEIQRLVRYAIERDFPVRFEEVELEAAKRSGALYFPRGHYPPLVKVYTVGDEREMFSRELCGGPHVTHTGEIGLFTITKEEASSAGVRRIRAMISP